MFSSIKLHDQTKGILYTLAGAFFFTLTTAFSKHATLETNALYTTFFRNFFGLIILTLLHLKLKEFNFPKPQANIKSHLLRAVLGIAATVFLFQSFALLPMQNATALTFTGPFFITLLTALILKERIPPNIWLALSVGFLGIIFILGVTINLSVAGFIAGLLAALCNAAAVIVIKSISKKESSFVIVYFYTLLATIITALWVPFNWYPLSSELLITLVFLAASSVSAHYFMAQGLRFSSPSTLAPFNYTSLIWATLLGSVIWNDDIRVTSIIGCLLIIYSGWIIVTKNKAA